MFDRVGALYLTSGFLNNEDNAYQGGSQGLAGVPGQLGLIVAATTAQALALSKTSVGTLYGGLYQVVQFKSTSTTAPARGGLCFWSTRGSYIVTPDATAATETELAGVYVNAPTKGNYGIIQVGGLASVLFRASVTNKTAGNICLQLTTTNTADAILDATGTYVSGGVLGIKNIIGSCVAAPSDGGVTTVSLKNIGLNL